MSKHVQPRSGSLFGNRGKQRVGRKPCFARNALQRVDRWGMNAANKIANGRLTNTDAPGKLCLARLRRFKVRLKCLHMPENIGLTYTSAIGSSYTSFAHNQRVAKPKERSFLDRALEALSGRYPNERPTQVRLGKIVGMSQPAVHEWGLPGRAPAHAAVLTLAKELNVCVEWLYTERGPKHPLVVPEEDPFLKDWGQLDADTKKQLENYRRFLRGEPPVQ